MKNYFVSICIILILSTAFIFGQFFPKENLEELEKKTEQAEKTQEELKKQAELQEKIKAEHNQRWNKFSQIRKNYRTEYLKSINTGKVPEVIKLLSRSDLSFHRGKLYFHLEQWSRCTSDFMSALGDRNSVQNMNGECLEFFVWAKLAEEYDGENFDDRIEKKIERIQRYIFNSFLPGEENKEFTRHKEARLERIANIKIWVENYLNKVKESEELVAKIKENTKNAQLIWDYYHFLENELFLSLKAQEWLEVLDKEFKNDPYVELGWTIARRNEYIGKCGYLEDSIQNLTELRAEIQTRVDNLHSRRRAIAEKMKEENIKYEDLDDSDIRILDMKIGESREQLAQRTRRTIDRYKDSLAFLERVRRGR